MSQLAKLLWTSDEPFVVIIPKTNDIHPFAWHSGESWGKHPVTKEATGSQQSYVDIDGYHGNRGADWGAIWYVEAGINGREYADIIFILWGELFWIGFSLHCSLFAGFQLSIIRRHFRTHFREWKYRNFISNFTEICFQLCNNQYSSIVSDKV